MEDNKPVVDFLSSNATTDANINADTLFDALQEEWICGQNQNEIFDWINQNDQEKIQNYLSYNWNNPSERVMQHTKNLLSDKINNPISTLCKNGDPSNGELLRILLNLMDSLDIDYFEDQQSFLSIAVTNEKLTVEQLRMILTHPKATDPFAPNPEGADCSYRQKESAIEITIRKENVEYFKEMLKHSKSPRMDKALKLACRHSTKILQYLIEHEGLSVSDVVCGKTPLQHALNFHGQKKPAADYLLSRGADITVQDKNGNLAIFYACAYGYNDTARLINPTLNLRAKTNKMRRFETLMPDGVNVFGVAALCLQYNVLKQLLELKSTLPYDPELDRQIIEDLILYGDYVIIWTMWPYVRTSDIIAFLITERIYEINYGEKLKPIEKLFRDYKHIQEKIALNRFQWDLMRQESTIRALWKHALNNFSREEIETLLNTETRDGEKLRYFVESQTLLPDDYRLSNTLWRSEPEYNLGTFLNLPREIVSLVFSYLTFNDACQTAAVSKSWFKEITAKQIWIAHPKADPDSTNPFRSIQKSLTNDYIRNRYSECFRQAVHVDDGEGLLVLEHGFLTGLKLNGEPIISSWPQYDGSIFRCMVRSRSLSQTSIESAVKQIETVLNKGHIDFESLVDTMMPFMKCLSSGFYEISVQVRGDYRLFEYTSDSDLSEGDTDFPIHPLVYFTQPSDLLNKERVKYYEEQIRKGRRPAALAIAWYEELFIIDGHHKITAYKNLGLIEELVVISICSEINEVHSHKISVEEEMKYIKHSQSAQDRYNEAKKSMHFGADE